MIQQVTAVAGIQAVTVLSQQPEVDRPITAVRRKIQPEQAVQIKIQPEQVTQRKIIPEQAVQRKTIHTIHTMMVMYMDDDYDYDRYYKDSDYADGVDDAMDDLDEDW